MSKPVLIVGGGPAGLAAAHSLGSVGKECVIVEKEDRLGGAPILSGYAKLVPTGEWAKDAIGGMVTRAEGAAGVSIETGNDLVALTAVPTLVHPSGAPVEVLAERGPGGATVGDVARRARVASGTFYNHFPSMDDLIEAVSRGIDMFDCVAPTRNARHGTAWTLVDGQVNLTGSGTETYSFTQDVTSAAESYTRRWLSAAVAASLVPSEL